jgi:N6-L-threonylcarbamoyladenine synthase
MDRLFLGIETSCDDTACAIFSRERGVVASKTASQLDHEIYGGVVPEIASRAHMRTLLPIFGSVMEEAGIGLAELSGIGVTQGPGLTGSLLVGLSFAKAVSYGSGVPLVGIHHLEGHILANALEKELSLPALFLVVSGGHTQLILTERIGRYRFLGGTRDDAAGEAFDKIGKLLGLPFPGGPSLERAARGGNRSAFDFPRGLRRSGGCDFSFSGLKTAVRLEVESLGELTETLVRDVAASAQEAICEVLAEKSLLAARKTGIKRFYLAGGVAANGRLHELMGEMLGPEGIEISWPAARFCTDNAAMISCAAYYHITAGYRDGLELNTFPRGELGSWA